jgi:hypothetical protein
MTSGSVSFNNHHLVYSDNDCYGGFYVYREQDFDQAFNQPYILQQHVNFTGLGYSGGCVSSSSISHDKDLLVVGGVSKTHIYVEGNNGSWEEQLTLDNWFRQYRVSGRNILASIYNETTNEDEVYYFNIEECARTPTQVPSSSTAPSSSAAPTPSSTMGIAQEGGSVGIMSFQTGSPTLKQYNLYSR